MMCIRAFYCYVNKNPLPVVTFEPEEQQLVGNASYFLGTNYICVSVNTTLVLMLRSLALFFLFLTFSEHDNMQQPYTAAEL